MAKSYSLFSSLSSPPYVPHAPPIILFHSITPDNTWLEAHIMKFLNVYSPSVRYYHIPTIPKYTPHHTILEDTKPTYFPQCERPNFYTHKSFVKNENP